MEQREPTTDDIDALLKFLPLFEQPGREFSVVRGDEMIAGVFSLPYHDYAPDVMEFISLAEQDCWTDADFWTNSAYHLEQADTLLEDDDFPARASLAQIRTALTRCVRFERFCDGQLDGLLRSRFIVALLKRLRALRQEMQ